jgi:uncharacterized protein with HEPN domain
MLSERAARCFRDILSAIDLIDAWVAKAGGREQVFADAQLRSAVERQLMLISEAAIRLHRWDPEALDLWGPSIDWAGVRGMGNVLRHRYDDLDVTVIVGVVEHGLAPLRQVCVAALSSPPSE